MMDTFSDKSESEDGLFTYTKSFHLYHDNQYRNNSSKLNVDSRIDPEKETECPVDSDCSSCSKDNSNKHLRLMMIACEDSPPYGPSNNTANMFLSMLEKVFLSSASSSTGVPLWLQSNDNKDDNVGQRSSVKISITVYEAKQKQYPKSEKEWNSYHGIILPGSFSSAYDEDEWIQILKGVIQSEIHPKCRKTLAVCFGHQIFAHSFQLNNSNNNPKIRNDNNITHKNNHCNNEMSKEGFAVPCPSGTQIGRREFVIENVDDSRRSPNVAKQLQQSLSSVTQRKNGNRNSLSMLYTHGDMVQSLPSHCAASLGGTSNVPIQAAAYFGVSDKELEHPYAFTFQGHPEYASEIGIHTFLNILTKMESSSNAPKKEALNLARNNAAELLQQSTSSNGLEADCVNLLKFVAETFDWINPKII